MNLPAIDFREDPELRHLDLSVRKPLLALFPTTLVKILVVVDTEISINESPSSFGVARVIRLLRETRVGCMRFKVDIARRSNAAFAEIASPAADQPRYEGFRFDAIAPGASAPVINGYHELFLFGFKPDNSGGPDANITAAYAMAATDSELRVLTRWMNERDGGIFATGDHDYLGASMCHRIPRVRSMRLWTNAQGVPPIDGPERIDANRPATGSTSIPTDNQSDAIPQPISWVTWRTRWAGLKSRKRPHPVLCHPTLGPIDVMPDHAHEGKCFETNPSFPGPHVSMSGTYSFGDGVAGPEYPSVSGHQETPMVIARGRTLPDPPYDFEKGDSPEKTFAMISVYDGHAANVGRVVVDSTWHHWMDLNLYALERENADAWAKISRYFINVAQWLAPPGMTSSCVWWHIVRSRFEYIGLQEYHPRLSTTVVGQQFRSYLRGLLGPCWVSQWIWDAVRQFEPRLWAELQRKPPEPECLSCPPEEWLEDTLMGAMVRQIHDELLPLRQAIFDRGAPAQKPSIKEIEKMAHRGLVLGLEQARAVVKLDAPAK